MCRPTLRHAVIVSNKPPTSQQQQQPQSLLMAMMMMLMMILSAVHSAGKLLSFRHHACYARHSIILQWTCFPRTIIIRQLQMCMLALPTLASTSITTRTARVVLVSVVSVCVSGCLLHTINPEPLEISLRNFLIIVVYSKGQTSSKMAKRVCADGDIT